MNSSPKKCLLVSAVTGLIVSGTDMAAAPSFTPHLAKDWFFTGKVSTAVPAEKPADAKAFQLDRNHGIDLDAVAGKTGKCNDECIVYNQFELKEASELGFSAGADWWMEVYLNGKKIFTTLPKGNHFVSFSADNHSFSGKGRKGKNLLAVMVRRGNNSWSFYCKEKNFAAVHPSAPITITADPGKTTGKVKYMNGINNGPVVGSRGRGNMQLWKAAAIPYARNHDAAFFSGYGGEHSVDVHAIFPDFSKDPDDPASYDFARTDRYLKTIMAGGTKVFYRLGSKIEPQPEKYGTKVPPDFKKWAVICEHIIRHYNEGWANGFRMDIEYWEIWNEPDLGFVKASSTWQGTKEQFFEFFRVAATHLKTCFPKLKIGGPALACDRNQWMKDFLTSMTSGKKRVPMDFFSWHFYGTDPNKVKDACFEVRTLLDRFGYKQTESILNEWNYNRSFEGEAFNYSIRTVIGLKGAAFTAAVMCAGQNAPTDMLMYYDARPCAYNGLFDFYTYSPLKTYYVFLAWSKLVKLGRRIEVDTQEKTGIYAVGATDGKKTGILISRFFDNDDLPQDLPVTLTLKNGDLRGVRLYLIDDTHDLTEIPYRMDKKGNLLFEMKANTVVYLEK